MTVGRHDGKSEMENADDGRLPQGLKPEFQQEGGRRPEGLLHPGAPDYKVDRERPEGLLHPGTADYIVDRERPEALFHPGAADYIVERERPEGLLHPGTADRIAERKRPEGLLHPGATDYIVEKERPEGLLHPGAADYIVQKERPEGLLHPGAAANITADQSCNRPLEPKAEPIRAELLYPQLRGMHCVTKTVLWVMSGYQNAAPEEAHGRSTANGGDGLVWAQSGAGEITCTDRSVCATQFWAASAELALHFPKRVFPGRPLMGPPFLPQPRNAGASGELALMLHGMAYEPVNEMGVVFLFGMVAPLLGFRVEALQTGFPDCKAKLEVEPGRWQDVNVEFEFESRKFRDHHHDPLKCDIIVCWRHNWKGCPERIQVVELSRILGVSR
ncbi:MAG TPA: hypothetical protein VFP59_10280 [Candidatus Angelobacter sp.]|nr:hypothetical protein [Candidatus Angelobacter sp.]